MSATRLILKREDWPNQDRAAWDALFVGGSIFDERGPCVDWSAGSRCKREQSYGHWLGFLTNAGLLDAACSPADRFTPDAVRAFVEATRARVSLISTSTQTTDLYVLATVLNRDRDWSWLKRIADRLEIHYTPKHGSWLDMAEIELGILGRQCLDRRIDNVEMLTREVAAWEAQRNAVKAKVNWRFTTDDARIRLKKLYPSFEV